ncbi:MAG: hypothetical protein IJ087_10175 [Eggerthellaceae bacterium]|nr:hypothetical protein [Eggerthellaceae bacterium]
MAKAESCASPEELMALAKSEGHKLFVAELDEVPLYHVQLARLGAFIFQMVGYLPIVGIGASFVIGAMSQRERKPQLRLFSNALEAERDGWLARRLLLV